MEPYSPLSVLVDTDNVLYLLVGEPTEVSTYDAHPPNSHLCCLASREPKTVVVPVEVQDTLEDGVGVVEPVSTGSSKLASQLHLQCEASTSAPSQELAELLQRPHLLVWPLGCAQSGVM
ncbi:hypothetical protein E2C01_033444 [Portunus trituberculatus]|uniref:Uncharacterized protein n=1 Tax=Portunus trituberculatus TaxID=210409 RepID=A0A5B7F055_PORTR|nr:hypothetical protein [Portunus trituberculatus]